MINQSVTGLVILMLTYLAQSQGVVETGLGLTELFKCLNDNFTITTDPVDAIRQFFQCALKAGVISLEDFTSTSATTTSNEMVSTQSSDMETFGTETVPMLNNIGCFTSQDTSLTLLLVSSAIPLLFNHHCLHPFFHSLK